MRNLPPGFWRYSKNDETRKVIWTLLAFAALLLFCAVGVLLAIALPSYLEASISSKTKRTLADMRTLAKALEDYHADNGAYPVYTIDPKESINASSYESSATECEPNFAQSKVNGPAMLTTPIAYLTSLPYDIFSPAPERTFNYYSDGVGWIVWSAGPDGVYDLDWTKYSGAEPEIYDLLAPWTYDPTNGTESPGDIVRMK